MFKLAQITKENICILNDEIIFKFVGKENQEQVIFTKTDNENF